MYDEWKNGLCVFKSFDLWILYEEPYLTKIENSYEITKLILGIFLFNLVFQKNVLLIFLIFVNVILISVVKAIAQVLIAYTWVIVCVQ